MSKYTDLAEGLYLHKDEDGGCTVTLEEDEKFGASLLFAYHEGVLYHNRTAEEFVLDNHQQFQIEEWFDAYEAI